MRHAGTAFDKAASVTVETDVDGTIRDGRHWLDLGGSWVAMGKRGDWTL